MFWAGSNTLCPQRDCSEQHTGSKFPTEQQLLSDALLHQTQSLPPFESLLPQLLILLPESLQPPLPLQASLLHGCLQLGQLLLQHSCQGRFSFTAASARARDCGRLQPRQEAQGGDLAGVQASYTASLLLCREWRFSGQLSPFQHRTSLQALVNALHTPWPCPS